MKKNKILKLTALGLAVAVTATGTLAYLKNSTTKVTNTFAAAELLEKDPEGIPIIKLDETQVEYDKETNEYRLGDPDDRTNSNRYDKIIPGVPVMKDPVLKINLEQDINAYVYLEVEEENMCDDLVYDIRREWIPLQDEHGDQVEGEHGGLIYYHEGDDEVTNSGVLRDDSERGNTGERTYYILENNEIRPNSTANCTTPGHNHYSGELHFYAYVCQAAGFSDSAEAFKEVFK